MSFPRFILKKLAAVGCIVADHRISIRKLFYRRLTPAGKSVAMFLQIIDGDDVIDISDIESCPLRQTVHRACTSPADSGSLASEKTRRPCLKSAKSA
jgi:hypothetical protein